MYSQNLSQIWQKSLTRYFTSESTVLKKSVWESPGSLVVRIRCAHYWVRSLVKEPRSYKHHSCRSVPRLVQLFVTTWTAACQVSQSFIAQRGKKKKNQSDNNKTKIQSLRFITVMKLFVLWISTPLSSKEEAHSFVFGKYLLRSYPVQCYVQMYT